MFSLSLFFAFELLIILLPIDLYHHLFCHLISSYLFIGVPHIFRIVCNIFPRLHMSKQRLVIVQYFFSFPALVLWFCCCCCCWACGFRKRAFSRLFCSWVCLGSGQLDKAFPEGSLSKLAHPFPSSCCLNHKHHGWSQQISVSCSGPRNHQEPRPAH